MKNTKKTVLVLLTAVLISCTMIFAGCANKGKTDRKVKYIDVPLSQDGFVFGAAKTAKGKATIEKVNKWIEKNKDTVQKLMEKYNTKSQDEIAKTTKIEYATKATDDVDNEFVVTTSPDYPPYEYEYDGKYYGVDMEIAQMMAKEFGQKLVVEETDFDSVIPATQKEGSKTDLAMAGLSRTPEREESLYLSENYVTDSQVIMVNKKNAKFDNAKTAEDIKAQMKALLEANNKLVLAAQKGTTALAQAKALQEEFGSKVQVLEFKSPALALIEMMNGRVDVVIVDKAVAKLLQKNIKKR